MDRETVRSIFRTTLWSELPPPNPNALTWIPCAHVPYGGGWATVASKAVIEWCRIFGLASLGVLASTLALRFRIFLSIGEGATRRTRSRGHAGAPSGSAAAGTPRFLS